MGKLGRPPSFFLSRLSLRSGKAWGFDGGVSSTIVVGADVVLDGANLEENGLRDGLPVFAFFFFFFEDFLDEVLEMSLSEEAELEECDEVLLRFFFFFFSLLFSSLLFSLPSVTELSLSLGLFLSTSLTLPARSSLRGASFGFPRRKSRLSTASLWSGTTLKIRSYVSIASDTLSSSS